MEKVYIHSHVHISCLRMVDETTIEAPIPGVFYRRPDPEEPVFAEEGEEVSEGDTIALVGVMKNFHDITAETDGVIKSFLIDNEEEIEAGDPVATLEPK